MPASRTNPNPAPSASSSAPASATYATPMPWAVRGTAAVASSSAAARPQRPAVVANASGHAVIHLRYTESSPILVRGPVTGKTYQFSAAQPLQPVDTRDAPSLYETRFFRRA